MPTIDRPSDQKNAYVNSTAIVGRSTPRSKYVNARQGVIAEKYTAICAIELPNLPLMICRGLKRCDRKQVVGVVFALGRKRAERGQRHHDDQRQCENREIPCQQRAALGRIKNPRPNVNDHANRGDPAGDEHQHERDRELRTLERLPRFLDQNRVEPIARVNEEAINSLPRRFGFGPQRTASRGCSSLRPDRAAAAHHRTSCASLSLHSALGYVQENIFQALVLSPEFDDRKSGLNDLAQAVPLPTRDRPAWVKMARSSVHLEVEDIFPRQQASFAVAPRLPSTRT